MNTSYLPEEFLSGMKELLKEDYQKYLDSFDDKRVYGLRINNLKISAQEFLNLSEFNLKPVPWIKNGFFYDESDKLSKHPFYYAGLYYLQEPSAMTPAMIMPVEPGDRVLDICAAPGGKSTELGAKLCQKGMLFANDISNSRAKALLKNLELAGVPNICVTSETPENLRKVYPEYFDKILIDAPCSGEGMFRREPDMVKDWMDKGPRYYSDIQKNIADEAIKMLKPGGCLVYSTCTFSVLEDEGTIRYILEKHKNMELVPVKVFDGASDGIDMKGVLRLFPYKIQGEGHFIALLKKKKDAAYEQETIAAQEIRDVNTKIPSEVMDFLKLTSHKWDLKRFFIRDDMVYYLPEHFSVPKGIRFLRTGLFMGEIKKNRFEPAQAFAMALRKEEFTNIIDLKVSDERVIRYLKAETISLNETEAAGDNGWYLVCVDGYPLGWAKKSGAVLKNKYYSGWRWQ